MKIKRLVTILLIFCIVLQGCSSFSYIEDENDITEVAKDETTSLVSFHEKDNTSFIKELPAQFCSTKDGVYHLVFGNYVELYFYDFATGIDTIVCSKIDCNHDTDSCVSYLSSNDYYDFYIYNDYIYELVNEDDGIFLYKYNKNGVDYEKFAILYDNNKPCYVVLGRQENNNIYYKCRTDDNMIHICRMNLDTGKYIEFGQFDGEYYGINAQHIFESEQYIYVDASHYAKDENDSYKEVIYRINVENNNSELVYESKSDISVYQNDGHIYIMNDNNELIILDEDKKSNLDEFLESSGYEIFVNDRIVCLNKGYLEWMRKDGYNERGEKINVETDTNIYIYELESEDIYKLSELNCKVIDSNGNKIDDYELESILGITDDYCYIYGGSNSLYMLDFSTIGSDEVLIIKLNI